MRTPDSPLQRARPTALLRPTCGALSCYGGAEQLVRETPRAIDPIKASRRYWIVVLLATVVLSCHGTDRTGDSEGLYRKIRPTDLCLEREVFTAPSKDKLAGRLSEESTAYRESPAEQPRRAIRFSIWTDGRRLDIWRQKDVVMQWYVLKDQRYQECSWIASPEQMVFGPNDVLASTPIKQTGPGRWDARPGIHGGV